MLNQTPLTHHVRLTNPMGEPESTSEGHRIVRSEALFRGRRLVLIEHAGQQYRLLITRNDRLILQK